MYDAEDRNIEGMSQCVRREVIAVAAVFCFEPEPERMRGKDKSSLIPNYPHIGGWLNHG